MADFFYWNKTGGNEGFGLLSVYLKTPSNGKPGWYFAFPASYPVTYTDRGGSQYRKMPVKFGIHHNNATNDDAHKPTKMGNPGDYLVQSGITGLQIIDEREYGLLVVGKSTSLPGQKVAESSITLTTGATGTAPTPASSPSMGGGGSGGY